MEIVRFVRLSADAFRLSEGLAQEHEHCWVSLSSWCSVEHCQPVEVNGQFDLAASRWAVEIYRAADPSEGGAGCALAEVGFEKSEGGSTATLLLHLRHASFDRVLTQLTCVPTRKVEISFGIIGMFVDPESAKIRWLTRQVPRLTVSQLGYVVPLLGT